MFLYPLLFILVAYLLKVGAQTSKVVCDSQWSWTSNSLGQNPCVMAAYARAVCSGNTDVGGLDPGTFYTGPQNLRDSDGCWCSSVTYSLLSACQLCQGEIGMRTWVEWSLDCRISDTTNGGYPREIPAGTAFPAWAFQAFLPDERFSSVEAQNIAASNKTEITRPAPASPSSTPSTPPPSPPPPPTDTPSPTDPLPQTSDTQSPSSAVDPSNTLPPSSQLLPSNSLTAGRGALSGSVSQRGTSVVPSSGTPTGEPTSADSGARPAKSDLTILIAGLVGGVVGLALVVFAAFKFIYLRRRRRVRPLSLISDDSNTHLELESKLFFPNQTRRDQSGALKYYNPSDPSTFPSPATPSARPLFPPRPRALPAPML